MLTDYDLYLFNEGNHNTIYEKLGAHIVTENEEIGVSFAVWAPNATGVCVIGSFNSWQSGAHKMAKVASSGIWYLFIPGIHSGAMYKFEIICTDGKVQIKADPYAFASEKAPGNASIVTRLDDYIWNDREWIKKRSFNTDLNRPMSIYEVHAGSWDRVYENGELRYLSYRELADRLIPYLLETGFTHVEFLPLAEHPFDGSWGYQITGYYSVTCRYGSLADFMYLVDQLHQNGIGVIMDWVPAHFPRDAHGLATFDGTCLYEHKDPRQGSHPDWGTLIFNYGRPEVKNFLISNAYFWFDRYHIDGLRVDAVASMLMLDYGRKDGEWIPNINGGKENLAAVEFLKQLNTTVFSDFPGILMIAEESTAWPMVTKPPYVGGLGFSYKWNMGWMNDFLRYMSTDPIHRKYHHSYLTFSIMYSMSENYILPLSHDEVVHCKNSLIGKMPGSYHQKFAGLRASYGYMFGHPGKKLLFMGGEFGQFSEWNHDKALDWNLLDYPMHSKLKRFVSDLNHMYSNEKALFEQDSSYRGFEWVDCNDSDQSIVSFLRRGKKDEDTLLFICNFTPVIRVQYRAGVPFKCNYKELLNSDSEIYGGSNIGNLGSAEASEQEVHGRPYSLRVTLPPLSTLVFKPEF